MQKTSENSKKEILTSWNFQSFLEEKCKKLMKKWQKLMM